MKLDTQKRLAATVMKCSEKRVLFDTERLEDISEAITKADIRNLVSEGAITEKPVKGISRVRANKRLLQRRKGRQKGPGSRKGTRNARLPSKEAWMDRIRSQRKHLRLLREGGDIEDSFFRDLYRKAKGGFFRSKRHINLYIDEHSTRKEK
jgi:large subunit ribosomal protein L19e